METRTKWCRLPPTFIAEINIIIKGFLRDQTWLPETPLESLRINQVEVRLSQFSLALSCKYGRLAQTPFLCTSLRNRLLLCCHPLLPPKNGVRKTINSFFGSAVLSVHRCTEDSVFESNIGMSVNVDILLLFPILPEFVGTCRNFQ
jgi:hypothetical protein